MSRVSAAFLILPLLAACDGYAAREAQSISSLQGEVDEDQVEYGPSDLSAQSDAYMAAVASQIALLGGGPDAVTPAGLRAIDRSLTYVKGPSKRPGQVSVISASKRSGNRCDVSIGYVLLAEVFSRRRCPDLWRGTAVHGARRARCGGRGLVDRQPEDQGVRLH